MGSANPGCSPSNRARIPGRDLRMEGKRSDIPGRKAANIESAPQRSVRQNYRCGTLILNTGKRPSVLEKYTPIHPGLQA